ncbi:MAG TPA: DUF4175 family protein [Longimicrobiales bacterium]|nr:DUF4175 family protein [Longimicrobiales bacterium]
MTNTHLLETLRRVRRRWRTARLLRGAAVFIAALLALVALSAAAFSGFGFSRDTVIAMRIVAGTLAALALVYAIVIPLMHRADDARVALYIEERAPELRSMLISAVEAKDYDNPFVHGLVERAAAEVQRLDYGGRIEKDKLRRNGLAFATALAFTIMLIAAGPPIFRQTSSALLLRTPPEESVAAMSIAITPGSDTIARGSNFSIQANLRGFDAAQAFVITRDQEGTIHRAPMNVAQTEGSFEAVLTSVQAAVDYYVESDGIRSPTYHVVVVDAPFVRSITLEYRFPAYTGMAAQRVENGGDIVAPRGTTVRILANTSAPVAAGQLRMSGGTAIPLQPHDAGLGTTMRIMRDGFYSIELPDFDGHLTNASAQYAITALADQPPTVAVEKPGRDVKVTAVDEVFISASAQDDYGVSDLQLAYAVNGGAQQFVSLAKPQQRTKSASGAYTFMLEDLKLQPGDIVSYFVRATDNNAIDGARTATSDIYFIQIRPFNRNYRAAEQQGQPGQGQQQDDDPTALSEKQRQIVAATFNVIRDSATFTRAAYDQAINTIELSQQRLREQVNTLVQRMRQRGVVSMDSLFAQIAVLLPQAAKEMEDAEGKLNARTPKDAIRPEQRALQQLTRAEALYKDVQVQMMQQQQQGGGGGGASVPEDLADLFELERDKMRNQYEAIQRNTQELAQRQVDEALQRLKELAQRQQQSNQGSGAQRRLADETEQAARQLERLAREQRSQAMSEAARSLQEAANAMRQQSSSQSGNPSATARQRMDEARRSLQQNQQRGLQERIAEARRRAEELRDQTDQTQRNQGANELQGRVDRMATEARTANPQAGRALDSAANTLRGTRDLGRTAEQLRNAEQAAGGQSREGRAQESAESVRRMAEGLESMRERAGQGNPGQGGQRQLRAEASSRARALRDMQRQLQQMGMPTDQIEAAIDALNGASASISRGDSKEIERLLAKAARAAEAAEFDLRRIAQTDASQRLFTNGRATVPAQYRKAVEEYYRSLARTKARTDSVRR